LPKSIIISGPPAIGKTTVAKGLAKEFGMQNLSGGDVLKEMAQERGFRTRGADWWDTKEGMTFLDQRKDNYEFDKKVDEKLKEIFLKGGVVITSYTLPWLVSGGIKIWLGGSRQNSAKRMQNRDNMELTDAFDIVKNYMRKTRCCTKSSMGLIWVKICLFLTLLSTRTNWTHNRF